jgi:hypothetical protein
VPAIGVVQPGLTARDAAGFQFVGEQHAVRTNRWPTHDAQVTFTAHRDDLLALLEQARAEITAAEPVNATT